jgi:hypothetical protein
LINLPITEDFGHKYPIIQYVDYTLMIMHANIDKLLQLKELFNTFSASTSLKVNFHKTTLVPMNIDNDQALELASAVGCRVESLPFTNLGLPLGTTRPSVADLIPMV